MIEGAGLNLKSATLRHLSAAFQRAVQRNRRSSGRPWSASLSLDDAAI